MGGLFTRALATAAVAFMAAIPVAKAVPFASCVTNTGGTISFYLNESGGSVTVTYGDGTTNANYNGVTTGTNLAVGVQTGFTLPGTNTTYSISVQKNGSGAPSLIASVATTNPRGVAADKVPTSPYFGRVYFVDGGIGVNLLNSDMSVVQANATAGLAWATLDSGNGTGHSPDWVTVDPNGTGNVYVTGTSSNGSCIWQVPGNFTSNLQVLANVGSWNGSTIYSNHGAIAGPVVVTGSLASNNLTIYTVDGEGPSGYTSPAGPALPGQLFVYHIGSGPLPWPNPPDNTNFAPLQITLTGFSLNTVGNFYPGMTQGPPPNNYLYLSTYRNTPGSANFVTISDSTGTNCIWSSEGEFGYPLVGTPPTGDWFFQTNNDPVLGNFGQGDCGGTSAVSADGNYLVGESIDNYLTVCPLTNGIPNTAQIFTVSPTSYTGNGRGVAFDAADNIITSSSGEGVAQSWSLGISATAITTGNLSGTTGFQLIQPSTTVSVVATQPFASQNTSPNGTGAGPATPGTFSVYRFSTNGYGSAQTVKYVLGGTATTAGGVYTISGGTTNSAVILAGQTNVTITITPTTANVPRATTTVTLNIVGGAGYSVSAPFADTVFIQNTSSQLIQIGALTTNMYRGFSNDFVSFSVTRLGDTTVASYPVNTFGSAGGTAILGTDYTAPTNITFSPGDIVYTNVIMPLVAGAAPVHVPNPTYVGNLTAVINVTAGTGYAAGATNTVRAQQHRPRQPAGDGSVLRSAGQHHGGQRLEHLDDCLRQRQLGIAGHQRL